jgi:hypothetical protein
MLFDNSRTVFCQRNSRFSEVTSDKTEFPNHADSRRDRSNGPIGACLMVMRRSGLTL